MTSVAVPSLDGSDETDRTILRELRQRIGDAVARLNDGQAVITLTATDAQSQTVTLSSQTESDPVIRISPL